LRIVSTGIEEDALTTFRVVVWEIAEAKQQLELVNQAATKLINDGSPRLLKTLKEFGAAARSTLDTLKTKN
jgi:hypothetical protein